METTLGKQCSVYCTRDNQIGYYCTKKPAIVVNGKTYCKIHDPAVLRAKSEKQRKEFNESMARADEQREEYSNALYAWRQCQSINPSNPLAAAKGYKEVVRALKQACASMTLKYSCNGDFRQGFKEVQERYGGGQANAYRLMRQALANIESKE